MNKKILIILLIFLFFGTILNVKAEFKNHALGLGETIPGTDLIYGGEYKIYYVTTHIFYKPTSNGNLTMYISESVPFNYNGTHYSINYLHDQDGKLVIREYGEN